MVCATISGTPKALQVGGRTGRVRLQLRCQQSLSQSQQSPDVRSATASRLVGALAAAAVVFASPLASAELSEQAAVAPSPTLQQQAPAQRTRVVGPPLLPLDKLLVMPAPGDTYQFGGKQLFNPEAYAGRWYEVASLKQGFAGEGQQDCHCTQGIYTLQQMSDGIKLTVNTFCVHGGPQGRLSGIQGSVRCANPLLLEVLPEFETALEREERIVEKCSLTFDSLPFLPAEPYDIIRTDYTTYALVQGATDRSFVQIYSRTPNPGAEFIAQQKAVLAELGYPVDLILDTPQDCPEMSAGAMMAKMDAGMAGKQLMPATTSAAVAMAGYDLGPLTEGAAPVKGVQFDSFRNPLETVRDLGRLLGF